MLRKSILLLSAVTNAAKINKECLTKLNVLAGSSSSSQTITTFDWKDKVLTDFDSASLPAVAR